MASSSQQHLRTTAGPGISPDIIEITLIYQVGWREFELSRIYKNTLPQKGDGIFLVFHEDTDIEPGILKFEVTQVCHIALDQHDLPLAECAISNQVTLYVQPKDNKTILYCHALPTEQMHGLRKLSVEEYARSMGRA